MENAITTDVSPRKIKAISELHRIRVSKSGEEVQLRSSPDYITRSITNVLAHYKRYIRKKSTQAKPANVPCVEQ